MVEEGRWRVGLVEGGGGETNTGQGGWRPRGPALEPVRGAAAPEGERARGGLALPASEGSASEGGAPKPTCRLRVGHGALGSASPGGGGEGGYGRQREPKAVLKGEAPCRRARQGWQGGGQRGASGSRGGSGGAGWRSFCRT